jgi:uncharacterized protein (DUF2235 family)
MNMPKNIVVFSDGTGQEGGKGNDTNVYRLFNMVVDRSSRQVAFYDRGLGTGWRKLTGNASGMGISKNILECYEFIFDQYEAGDQIYLFGFSRGATTVRSLSGFLDLFGILPKSRPELIKKAYKIYKIGNEAERKRKAEEFVTRHHNIWCRVKFLGVWDTVAALGVPHRSVDVVLDRIPFFRHEFHDLKLSPSVENAYHALAIDDERLTFHPTLWDPGIESYQSMKQVWFCGMHSDVGGGYAERHLSDLALEWMVCMARDHGLEIYPHHRVVIGGDPNGVMHDSRGEGFKRLFRRAERSWNAERYGDPTVHQSVVERKLGRDNSGERPYKPWILDGSYRIKTEDRVTLNSST